MTWTKLSDDYTDRMEYVSDVAFRLHTEMLTAINKRESGPYLTQSQVLRKTCVRGDADSAIEELLDAGFWREQTGGYQIVEHMEHQIEPEVLAARRASTAQRQRNYRRKAAGLDPRDSETSKSN